MKKRMMFLLILTCIFVMLLLFASLASAVYICSDGSEISSSRREIEKYDEKTINGLGIGLLDSKEHAVLRKVEVDILADAKEISLANNSISLELESGTYTVTLINATADSARIQVGSSSKTLNEKETDIIGDLQVLIVEADLLNGISSAKIIAGKEKLKLNSQDNPRQILTFGSNKYGIELISASVNSAIISVSNCKTGNLTEKTGPIEENITEMETNQTTANETNEETNQSNINVTEIETNQTTANETNEDIESKEEESILKKPWFWIPTIILIMLIAYVFYAVLRKRNYETSKSLKIELAS